MRELCDAGRGNAVRPAATSRSTSPGSRARGRSGGAAARARGRRARRGGALGRAAGARRDHGRDQLRRVAWSDLRELLHRKIATLPASSDVVWWRDTNALVSRNVVPHVVNMTFAPAPL